MWYGTVTTTPTTTAEITSSTIATTTTTTTARICKNGGQPLTPALYEQGPDAAQGLLEGGFTPTQLIDAGYTKSDLIAAGLDEAVADAA
eukprot:gene21844-30357_t